ncbi:unnamed protein product [Linum trigynum]|uniref:Uncharacterized protein n=1 Tax=Linum trigynum TaxID=586398 RepID=A0AAV2CK77_9ROSI
MASSFVDLVTAAPHLGQTRRPILQRLRRFFRRRPLSPPKSLETNKLSAVEVLFDLLFLHRADDEPNLNDSYPNMFQIQGDPACVTCFLALLCFSIAGL